MSTRRAQIVLLCEDLQQEVFIRRFLSGMGWNTRSIRSVISPAAKGAGEQWVRNTFPLELRVYRQRMHRAASGLIVAIDADTKGVQDRYDELKVACRAHQVDFMQNDEAVALVIPKRNIETWIHHLNGHMVDEEKVYPKLERERECQPAVSNLIASCRAGSPTDGMPPALKSACNAYNARIKPLQGVLR
jgi:hypothetical protein